MSACIRPRTAPRSSSHRNPESSGGRLAIVCTGVPGTSNGVRGARTPLARRSAVRRLASEYRCTPDEIMEAISQIDRGYPLFGRAITSDELLTGEYRALIREIPDLREDEDFVTEHHTGDWAALGRALEAGVARRAAGTVSRLIAVNKLKEIMVFNGFPARGRTPDTAGPHRREPLAPCDRALRRRHVLHAERRTAATLGVR